jgi:periplasmic mercuric ion binding protein
MKAITLKTCITILFMTLLQAGHAVAQDTQTDTFKVWGNCSMCEKRIEEAAKGKGVISADWDVDTKMLILKYDPAKTTPGVVRKRIAAVGHDTQEFKAKDSVYKGLHKCCRYDRGAE